jgi:hypothetical protein
MNMEDGGVKDGNTLRLGISVAHKGSVQSRARTCTDGNLDGPIVLGLI